MKRTISLLLVVSMLLGMITGLIQAADSEESALSDIHIFNGGQSLNCLAVNGRVQEFNYVYYMFRSFDGTEKEIPTYCVNPTDPGVPQKVPVGSNIKYIVKERESDPKVMGIVANGYPTKSLGELGLNDKVEGYYATKIALWCYIIPGWNISSVTVNPAAADQAQAQRVLTAAKQIYDYGTGWTEVLDAGLTTSSDQPTATLTTIDGQQYKEQTFKVHSNTFVSGLAVDVTFADPGSVPAGTRIVNMDNQDITTVTMEGSGSDFNGQFKVLFPLESVEGQDGSVQFTLKASTYQYGVFYASCAEADTYGTVQNYICDTDPTKPVDAMGISKYTDSDTPGPEPDPDKPDSSTTSIKIVKLEEGTKSPLEGAIFDVEGPDGNTIGSFSTGPDGTITVPVEKTGSYVVTETTPPKHHLLSKAPTQTVSVSFGRTSTVTYENAPYGNLRVEKVSDTGDQLTGVTVQVKHIESGTTYSAQTGPGGAAIFEKLIPGAYEVSELAGIEGWKADTDTVKTVSVVKGETAVTTLTNKELPGLRILKYDRQTMTVMKNVSFEIYKDGELIGTKATNEMGEIVLTNLQPGTYRVVEVHTGDDEHLVDPNQQEVELHAGDGIKELTFFNSKKPGIHLVKVDSVTMKTMPNVRFEFKKVGGSYKQEFTTDINGEIDLSKLEPGAYEVTELEAPDGYLIDEAVRIIQLNPDENASFVFTNTPKPKLRIIKLSSDGTRLGGVHFRIARIEDGTHYLDRITEYGSGEINISNLEPGVYSVKETATTSDHILDVREYHVELFPGQTSTLTIENQRRPGLTIRKTDKDTGNPISGVTFTIRFADGHTITTMPTGPDGTVHIENLIPGVYTVTEQNVPDGYILDTEPQQITLFANREATVQFQNYKRPTLKIAKVDINGNPLTGAIFEVKTKAGVKIGDFPVGPDGTITVSNVHLTEGYYIVTEKQAPEGYILDATPHEVYLRPGKTTEISIENEKKPGLTIYKVDSVTGGPVKGAKFEIYVSKDKTENGTYQKLDSTFYFSDENGIIHLDELDTGWYKVKEVEPAAGFTIKEPAEQILYVEHDKAAEITFENTPLNGIVVEKYDNVTHAALPGCTFQLRYLSGTSGTGGTVIGQKVTGKNGNAIWTGLKPGAYVVEEVDPAEGYSILNSSETVYIADNGEQSVITVRFTNSPDGNLLVRKVCSVNPSVTLQNAEFKITYADGTVIGDSNGVFRTDENGEIRVEGLKPGKSVIVTETKAPAGFIIDTQSQTVQIKEGRTVSLTFKNQPKGGIIVQKRDSATGQPLPGAQFRVTTAAGCEVGLNGVIGTSTLTQNGLFTTDSNGEIRISNLAPGAYVLTETKAPAGYVMDSPSTNVVVGANGDTQTVVITNTRKATLTIFKRDAVTRKPLSGGEFIVRDSEGRMVGPNNGRYITGTDGTVTVTSLEPGATIMASEIKAPKGYILDETPQSIVVKAGVSNSLIFDNEPGTTLIIHKYIDGTENEPLSGVGFKVVDGSGAAVGPDGGVYYTDEAGEIVLNSLVPGTTVTVREIKTVDGFVLNGTPQNILIKGGEVQNLTFWNKRAGTLVIEKLDSITKAPLAGAQFKVLYADGRVVDTEGGKLSSNGIYTTDEKGQIKITQITGTLVVTEEKAPDGYVMDVNGKSQTVTVNPNDTQTLQFFNEPLCSLTIKKVDSVRGKPVPNTEFTVKDGNGNVIGQYTTGKDGTVTVTGLIPGAAYVVSETKVPSGYVLNPTPQTIVVKNGANTLNGGGTVGTTGTTGVTGTTGTAVNGGNGLTFENDPKMTLTIRKYIKGTDSEPLSGVTFKVTDGSGAPVGGGDGTFRTDNAGEIVIDGLEPGTTVTAREIETVEGYVMDGTPKSVKIQTGEKAPELVFWNQKAGGLVIRKLDKLTGKPLAGVEFELTYADGGYVDAANGHLSSKGLYTTDAQGEIRVSGITGTIVVKETKTLPGYTIDPGAQSQTVTVNPADTQTLTFYNTPGTTLTIQKYIDGTTTPIQGVAFLVTDSSGAVLGPNNGEYVTDKNGRIVINNLVPGVTIIAKEIKTADGYVLDSAPQSILIKEGEAQTLTFYNKSEGGLELIKVSASDKSKRIPNVTFEIRKKDGGLVETVTTGKNGSVHVDLDAGDYYAVEIEAAKGFEIDETPQYFTVVDGKTTTLTVTNKALSGILIHKINSVTGKGIQGVTFLLYDSTNTPIGQYTSDDSGYVYIENLTTTGRFYLRELENEGYVPDNQMKTVYVTAGETTLVEWKNIPITAQIQIIKRSADYNPTNGLPAGTLLEGAVFEIYDKANNLVDTIKSDQRGLAASTPLPLGRYTIREVKAPANYGVSDTVLNAYLEHEGQIVTFEVTNKALATGVNIIKTGPKEAMAGQPIRYQFSGIANRSNVRLDSFYWRDTLPAQVQLDTVVTGTYNFPGTYKITYRVNGGEPRALADSLSTSQNYTLAASPAALGLAANERVTEIMFVFGQAPAGFAQVETPYILCTALKNLKGGTSFVNVADAGGAYNGVWVQGVSRWVTSVYGKSYPLPKTGY